MNLVQITFYKDNGQKSFKVVNDVIPNSIHMGYRSNGTKYIAFTIKGMGHTWVNLEDRDTFGIYTNNLEV